MDHAYLFADDEENESDEAEKTDEEGDADENSEDEF